MTAAITLLTSFLRLMALVVLASLLHQATVWQWALSSLIVTALAAVVASGIVMVSYDRLSLIF